MDSLQAGLCCIQMIEFGTESNFLGDNLFLEGKPALS